MLLQRLKDYANERLDLPPTLYVETPVRYIIDLDLQGRLLSPRPIDTANAASRTERRGNCGECLRCSGHTALSRCSWQTTLSTR